MIMWEEIRSEVQKLKTDKKELIKFSRTMAVVLGIFTAIAWYRSNAAFPYLLLLAIGFLLVGILRPMLLKRLYVFWMTLALILGFIMTRVILSLLYYTAFTVMGIIARIAKRDRLDQKYESDVTTYWKPYEKPSDFKRHLERQF